MNNKTVNDWFAPNITPESLTELLMQQYYTYLIRLSASILRNTAEAEEVAQETLIIALTKIDTIDSQTNMQAWLSTIAVNKSRDILRKRKTRDKFQSVLDALRPKNNRYEMPEATAVDRESAAKLWQAVDQLKEKHRLPILLRYVHDMSIREIAEILETKEGTIQSRLHYACQKLNAKLDTDLPDRLAKEAAR